MIPRLPPGNTRPGQHLRSIGHVCKPDDHSTDVAREMHAVEHDGAVEVKPGEGEFAAVEGGFAEGDGFGVEAGVEADFGDGGAAGGGHGFVGGGGAVEGGVAGGGSCEGEEGEEGGEEEEEDVHGALVILLCGWCVTNGILCFWKDLLRWLKRTFGFLKWAFFNDIGHRNKREALLFSLHILDAMSQPRKGPCDLHPVIDIWRAPLSIIFR